MRSVFHLSLLAISFVGSSYATPLSTNPLNAPRQRSSWSFAPLEASEHPDTINNSYIVMLKDDVPSSLLMYHLNFLSRAHDADPLLGDDASGIQHVYDGHIKGYAGRFTESVVHQIRSMPEVAYVERDQVVRTMETQTGAPWVGIDWSSVV
jgi:cerevisin